MEVEGPAIEGEIRRQLECWGVDCRTEDRRRLPRLIDVEPVGNPDIGASGAVRAEIQRQSVFRNRWV
jgi:hypothetical protein